MCLQVAFDDVGQSDSDQLYFPPGQIDRPWDQVEQNSLDSAKLDGNGNSVVIFPQSPGADKSEEGLGLTGSYVDPDLLGPENHSVIVVSANDETDDDDVYDFDIRDHVPDEDEDEDLPYLDESTSYGAVSDVTSSEPCGCVGAEMVDDMTTVLDSVSKAGTEYDPTGKVHSYVNMVNYRLENLIINMQVAPSGEVAGTMCDLIGAMNSVYDAAVSEKRPSDMFGDMQMLSPPPTVGYVNMERMTGRWYQVASSRFVQWSMQHGAHCVVHDLRAEVDGSLTMRSAMMDASSGASRQYQANLTQQMPGKFRLESTDAGCALRPLWVIGLGPIVSGQYQWAILGCPFRMTLLILARDPVAFKTLYLADTKALVTSLGYNHYLSQPFRTVHDASCTYPGLLETVAAPRQSTTQTSSKVTVTVSDVLTTATVSATKVHTITTTLTVTTEAAGDLATVLPAEKSSDAHVADDDEAEESDSNCVLWIVLGSVLAALLLLLLCLFFLCRKNKRQERQPITAAFLSRSGCRFCGREKCHHNEEGLDKEAWSAVHDQGMGSLDHNVID